MRDRPVLLGMNSPQSEDPSAALYPWDMASTGGRILAMLREGRDRAADRDLYAPYIPQAEYLRVFDRRNMLDSKRWSPHAARARASEVRRSLSGRRVVVCGVKTLETLGLPRHEWLEWRVSRDATQSFSYCLIPHPSGLTRSYNEPSTREAVGDLLFKLYVEYVRAVSAEVQGA